MSRYTWRTRPYRHQLRAVRFTVGRFKRGIPHAALLMEPRTGKTKVTIDTLCILHQLYGLRKAVVICPNRVIGTWVAEFAAHAPLVVHTHIWDRSGRNRGVIPQPAGAHDLMVVLVNYEAFGTPGRRLASGRRSRSTGRFKHRKALRDWIAGDPCAGVLDESHKIKSPSGKAANLIVSTRDDFTYRLILTGTPVTKAKRAHDIYMQWQWLNPERFARWGATSDAFRNHTGRWVNKFGFPLWVGAREQGMRDLHRGIHEDAFSVTRAQCFDLPGRLPDRIVPITLTPKTAKHYDEMAEECITWLESGEVVEASIPLVATLRLLQITSGFVGVRDEGAKLTRSVRLAYEKLRALQDILVDDVLEHDDKMVIAARFKADLNAITKLCAKLKIPLWSIRGGVSREQSDRAIVEFRKHNDAGVMLVQPRAASLGIDLSTASQMVWYSLTPSYVDWTQTNDRIALSPQSTVHTYLLAQGTVDEVAYHALQADHDMARLILKRPEILRRST